MKKYALYAFPLVLILGIGVIIAEDIRKDIDAEVVAEQPLQQDPPQVGDMAPEIAEPGVNGDTIKLSSLRGKIVLIDFWASWCKPCRQENVNLVRTYKKFKDAKFENADGFTVYSVSLDNNADSWKNAIAKDKLSWEYHVSDLKHWQSVPAARYGVESIPANFLLDGTGKIVKRGLRGNDLDNALERLQ